MSDHREAIAEMLHGDCGYEHSGYDGPCTHLADALLGSDILAQIRAEARVEALRPVLALAAALLAWAERKAGQERAA